MSQSHTHTSDEIHASIIKTAATASVTDLAQVTSYDKLCEMTLKTVSEKSRRVYQNTFDHWQRWTDAAGVDIYALTPDNVTDFLSSIDGTKSTRQRHLYALRKLTHVMAILDGDTARKIHELLKLVKTVPSPDAETAATREKSGRALTAAECDAMLRVWTDDTSNIGRRNIAMISVMLMTGVRRAELVKIQWRDVDLSRGVIHIRDGKGGKPRPVSIMDGVDGLTVRALSQWRDIQTATGADRDYVFCSVSKGGRLGNDKPITAQAVYYLIKDTAERAGVRDSASIAPHDFRRTHITEILSTGGTLADAQAQAGHSDGSTTLIYAKSVDAESRRNNARFRFGGVNIAEPLPLTD